MELFEHLSRCEMIENASLLVNRLRPGMAIVTNQPAIIILPMDLIILRIEDDGRIEEIERLGQCEAIILFSVTLAQVLGAFSRPEQRVWLDRPIVLNPMPVDRVSFAQMRWLHGQLVTITRWVADTLAMSTVPRRPRSPPPQPTAPPAQPPSAQQSSQPAQVRPTAPLPPNKRMRAAVETEPTTSGGTGCNTAIRALLEPEVILCVKQEPTRPSTDDH